MKARRRVVTARPGGRTPTVRRLKPALRPLASAPRQSVTLARPAPGLPGAGEGEGAGAGAAAGIVGAGLDALGGRPVELTMDLGRGLVLPNPLLAASGPFGYGVEHADAVDLDRLGGIVTRSTTLRPRHGHGAPRMAEVPAGLLVGVGLQNPGIETVLERYASSWAGWHVPVIVSVAGETAGDIVECVRRLEGVPGVAGIELNLSCANQARGGIAFGLDPDAASSLVSAVRHVTELPVIAKLTAAATDIRAVARAVEEAGADAISAINTLPGLLLAGDRRGPLLDSAYGGIAGPVLKPVALRAVFEIGQVVRVPVIGIGGVTGIEDVLDLLAAGASAVGVGAAVLADPVLPVRLADELADACRERGIARVADLVGIALPRRPGAPSTRGAEYAR